MQLACCHRFWIGTERTRTLRAPFGARRSTGRAQGGEGGTFRRDRLRLLTAPQLVTAYKARKTRTFHLLHTYPQSCPSSAESRWSRATSRARSRRAHESTPRSPFSVLEVSWEHEAHGNTDACMLTATTCLLSSPVAAMLRFQAVSDSPVSFAPGFRRLSCRDGAARRDKDR